MRRLDLTLPDPAANLAIDEALLLAAEELDGGEVLRFWELTTPAVVLGAGGSVAADVDVPACERDGVPILRRASGGGTVVLGPGCLCFTLVLSYDSAPALHDIRASNRYILGRVAKALEPFTAAQFAGTSDLAVNGMKISGNAQQRKRWHVLHHGTILCGFALDRLPRYLHPPERQPDYRRHRSHAEFVASIRATTEGVKQRLADEWRADTAYGPVPWKLILTLVAEKYGRDEWNRRR